MCGVGIGVRVRFGEFRVIVVLGTIGFEIGVDQVWVWGGHGLGLVGVGVGITVFVWVGLGYGWLMDS